MAILTVMANGQVTFPKEILQHLGIEPGGKIRLGLLPDGRAEMRADQPMISWHDLGGLLKGRGNGIALSTEELNEAIAEAGTIAGHGHR